MTRAPIVKRPDLCYHTVTGGLVLSPSPPRIAPSQLGEYRTPVAFGVSTTVLPSTRSHWYRQFGLDRPFPSAMLDTPPANNAELSGLESQLYRAMLVQAGAIVGIASIAVGMLRMSG